MQEREARGGTLILGGGFAGAWVARLLGARGATIVNRENFMLFTSMLPEAASGTIEPRHVVVPLRQMCPHAELLLGRVTGEHDSERRLIEVETEAGELAGRGVEIHVDTRLDSIHDGHAVLSDGTELDTETLVWTTGVRPNPLLARLGLPLDDRGRVEVDEYLRVSERLWALGDGARVPNLATPGVPDPPTQQHALRQARRLAKNLAGERRPYRYRMLGQVAPLELGRAPCRGRRVMT